MGKVLDIRGRLPEGTNKTQVQQEAGSASSSGDLVDMTARREAEMNAERRQVRRTILTEFIAVHTVIANYGLLRVGLHNIHNNGVAIDIDERRGSFKPGEEIALRVYLNHQTYFPFYVRVRHITHISEEGVVRHGCEFVSGSINDTALQHFVAFLETVSASLKQDRGDVLVSNINS